MDVLAGPAIVLDAGDCTVLARQLVQAIQLGYTARGRPPPERLLDLANQLSIIARGSARFRGPAQVTAGSGTGGFRPGPLPASSEEPAWLTVQEAARVAGVSESYLRRLIRRGDVDTSQGRRSAGYRVDASSLAAWIGRRSRRQDDRTRKAA